MQFLVISHLGESGKISPGSYYIKSTIKVSRLHHICIYSILCNIIQVFCIAKLLTKIQFPLKKKKINWVHIER